MHHIYFVFVLLEKRAPWLSRLTKKLPEKQQEVVLFEKEDFLFRAVMFLMSLWVEQEEVQEQLLF